MLLAALVRHRQRHLRRLLVKCPCLHSGHLQTVTARRLRLRRCACPLRRRCTQLQQHCIRGLFLGIRSYYSLVAVKRQAAQRGVAVHAAANAGHSGCARPAPDSAADARRPPCAACAAPCSGPAKQRWPPAAATLPPASAGCPAKRPQAGRRRQWRKCRAGGSAVGPAGALLLPGWAAEQLQDSQSALHPESSARRQGAAVSGVNAVQVAAL